MSLDQNLFTLNLTPNPDDRNVVDLIDPSGTTHYRKRRVPGSVYRIDVHDPVSDSLLATATAPNATSKHKTLQLYNPDIVVELKYTGTISFRWSFTWEEHDFEWKREECFILRKPDPAVLVALTKEPAGRIKSTAVQILDYNLNRFDIHDRKGLEIVILTALLTFQDSNDAYHTPRADSASSNITSLLPRSLTRTSENGSPPAANMDSTPAPALPPKPAPRTGVERIAEMHMVRAAQGEGEANEVEVGEEGDVLEYAQYAEGLLKDEAMLFVTLRSASAVEVPKVLRVVEEAKRLRHKSGIADDEELHQYVVYDTGSSSERKGPKRINLNDPDPKAKGPNYAPAPPPTSLTVHLSKIDMPELQPRAEGKQPERKEHEKHKWWEKDKDKEKEKVDKRAEKEKKKAEKTGIPARPEPNKLTKPTPWPPSSSPPDSHIHSNQVHPYQPSPSPSQLNNPSIYVAPPPPHPSHSHFFQSYAPPPFPTPSTTPGSGSGSHHDHAPSAPNPAAKGPVTSLLEMWSRQ